MSAMPSPFTSASSRGYWLSLIQHCFRSECVELQLHRAEIAAAGGECHIGSAHAETDDVRHAVAVDVAKLARILVVADPAADSAAGPECLQLELHGGEIAAASGERDIDSADAETDDVRHAVAVHVA